MALLTRLESVCLVGSGKIRELWQCKQNFIGFANMRMQSLQRAQDIMGRIAFTRLGKL